MHSLHFVVVVYLLASKFCVVSIRAVQNILFIFYSGGIVGRRVYLYSAE